MNNYDNKLYQKLLDRAKHMGPGDRLNSPGSKYRFEVLTQKSMKKQASKPSLNGSAIKKTLPSTRDLDESYIQQESSV